MTGTHGSPEERFFRNVRQEGDCWMWNTPAPSGYATFWNGTSMVGGHRWAYEFLVAPIPEGLQLDHLCKNKACVNPYHLDPVPPSVNLKRSPRGPAAKCFRGHDMAEFGSKPDVRGKRYCRKCKLDVAANRTPPIWTRSA